MNHKSWKRSLESSLTAVISKQPRFTDPQEVQVLAKDPKLPVVARGAESHQKDIVLPPMKMEKRTSVLVWIKA